MEWYIGGQISVLRYFLPLVLMRLGKKWLWNINLWEDMLISFSQWRIYFPVKVSMLNLHTVDISIWKINRIWFIFVKFGVNLISYVTITMETDYWNALKIQLKHCFTKFQFFNLFNYKNKWYWVKSNLRLGKEACFFITISCDAIIPVILRKRCQLDTLTQFLENVKL